MTRPFKHFAPFSAKQKKLLSWWQPVSPYKDYDGVIAEGSIRSGKTVAMILSFVSWAQANFKNQNFIMAGVSIQAFVRNVQQPMFKMLRVLGVKCFHHKADHYITIGSNTFWYFGANNEASQDVIQGLTAAGALLDEAALMPESFIKQVIGRCSVEGAKQFWNCNPESPFHFIKAEFMDKAEEKRFLVLHFDMDDNLSLSGQVKERYRRMFSGLFYKRFILGLWVLAEGAIYDMWDEAKHKRTAPDDLNRFFVSIDYGTNNPCTWGLYGYKEQRTPSCYLTRERYYDSKVTGRQKTDAEYADMFEADLKQWRFEIPAFSRPLYVYCDPSAASFIAELRKRGHVVRPAYNDVLDGIRFVSSWLTGERFFVDPSCKATIQEFASYVWDEKASEKGEDKPLKEHDHAMDRNRYALFTHFRYSG